MRTWAPSLQLSICWEHPPYAGTLLSFYTPPSGCNSILGGMYGIWVFWKDGICIYLTAAGSVGILQAAQGQDTLPLAEHAWFACGGWGHEARATGSCRAQKSRPLSLGCGGQAKPHWAVPLLSLRICPSR